MEINWQVIGFGAANLITLVGAYYGLKADNTRIASELVLSMQTERSERILAVATMKTDLMVLISSAERSVEDLAHRVQRLESGQDEWTKQLRERTHELANKMQDLAMKVDRLERPEKHRE